MNTKKCAIKLTLILSLSALLTLSARADTYTWANPTVSGTWDTSGTFANGDEKWKLGIVSTTLVPGDGDDIILGNGTDALTVFFNAQKGYNSLVINNNVTWHLLGGGRTGFTNGITNYGLIQLTKDARALALNTSGGSTTITNSGTIQMLGAGTQLNLSANVNNSAGGLVSARDGATLNAGGLSVSGGRLEIATSSTLFQTDVQALGGFNLTNVDTTNAGIWEWRSNIGGGSRTKNTIVSGGTFNNTGVIILAQQGDVTSTGSNYGRALNITVQDGAVFTNSGTITISNTTPDKAPANQNASLIVSANAGAFTNRGLITVTNAATNTEFVTNSNQTAGLTVSSGSTFTNSGTISVRVDAAAADIVQHSAVLTVSGSWNNTGVVLIDSGGKSAAYASLDIIGSDRAYTQSGANAVTRLTNGGQLRAGGVFINGGLLAGSGTISANSVTINSGGVLDPDGTLTVNSSFKVYGGEILFSVSDGDLLKIGSDVDFGSGTLTLTDSAYTDGSYLFMEYAGTLVRSNLTVSGLAGFEYEFNTVTAGQIWLNVSAIPEPSVWALTVAGGVLLACLRRRRAV